MKFVKCLITFLFILLLPKAVSATNYCNHANTIFCVPAEESSGTAYDLSSNSSDCSFQESAARDSGDTPGSFSSQSIDFSDGAADPYLDCTDDAGSDLIDLADDFTIGFWIKGNQTNDYERYFHIASTTTAGDGVQVSRNAAAGIAFVIERGGDNDLYTFVASDWPTSWTYVWLEYDWSSDAVRYWKNCVDQTGWLGVSTGSSYTWSASTNMCWGSRCGTGGSGSHPHMDDLIIFDAHSLGTTVCNDIKDNGLGAISGDTIFQGIYLEGVVVN